MQSSHNVILVGGGHCHALFLKKWAENPVQGVQLTLISRDKLTPYSGMLPGYIAGHYNYEDIHVDLAKLCTQANVKFIEREMKSIDLKNKSVVLENFPDVSYDTLLLDTGSTPLLNVPGSESYTTPVKPVYNFIDRWNEILASNAKEIGVVGAGAGGYELVLAMAHRLRNQATSIHWFLRGRNPMSDRPEKVGRLALKYAKKAGIHIHSGFDVEQVEESKLIARDGRTQQVERLLWCTAATAPDWPGKAGLELDRRGFIATNEYLQSRSHPDVFATGDIGTQIETPSAKAGVFAVRQAPYLLNNVKAKIKNETLRAYVPQNDFLSLVSTGRQHAIGSRSGITVSGYWAWRLKHFIDQSFMNKSN